MLREWHNLQVRREKVRIKLARFIAEVLSERTNDVRHAIKIARIAKSKRDIDEAVDLLGRYKGI